MNDNSKIQKTETGNDMVATTPPAHPSTGIIAAACVALTNLKHRLRSTFASAGSASQGMRFWLLLFAFCAGCIATPDLAVAADGATFISETIPDNTVMTPGQGFTKTWTLKNSGTTTWTTGVNGYTLNFVSGSKMGAASYFTLSSAIAPNAQVTFSAPMTAPTTPGTYTGYWEMSNVSGTKFVPIISVKIIVAPNPPVQIAPGTSSSPGPTISTLTPQFSWNTVSGATAYWLYIRDIGTSQLYSYGPLSSSPYTIASGVLAAGHQYKWNMTSCIGSTEGNAYAANLLYFQTTAAVAPPTVASTAASLITSTSAQMNGTVNPNGADTTVYFQYGLTTSYGNQTGSGDCGSGTATLGAYSSWAGLIPSTTYHYRIVAYNSGGTRYGNDVSFTTSVQFTPLSFTSLTPAVINTSTAPYDATLSAVGANFNNVNQVTFSWTGAATGSQTWIKGDSSWNKVTVNSDTSITLQPRVIETIPTWSGTVNWTVTLKDASNATASKTFTVTYTPASPPLSFTSLTPAVINTSTAPYDATLSAVGANFNNVNQVTFSWTGAATGSQTWIKGDSSWNKVTVNSDTSITLQPRVIETIPTWSGTVNWTVTLKDTSNATAAKTFTVTYAPATTTVQLTGVPYIHQLYDTANDFTAGNNACGATAALMAIQYYGKLPSNPITCTRGGTHTSNYGSYISRIYSYNSHTFSIPSSTTWGSSDAGFFGGFGYFLQDNPGDSLQRSTRLSEYIADHGLTSSTDDAITGETGFTKICAEIDAGYPVVLLTSITTEGHYITCIGYVQGQHTLIFNDSYGNKTTGYPNANGAGVRYDWPGYNNGYQNLTAVVRVIYARGSTTDKTAPTISAFTVTPFTATLGQGCTVGYTVSDGGGSHLKQVNLWRANINGTVSDTSWTKIGNTIALSGDGPSTGSFPVDTPTATGNYWYGIHVIDNANNYMDERMAGLGPIQGTVSATPALSITSTAFNPATVTVGTVYAAQQAMTAIGGQTPYSWSASGLPNGMAINSTTGVLSGMPIVSGTFNVTVTVTDSSSPQKTASKVLSLYVVQEVGGMQCDIVLQGAPGISPNLVTAGNAITVGYTVTNKGPGVAGSSLTKIQIKNSSGTEITASTFAEPSLSTGSSVVQNRSITIPSSAEAGTYTVYVILDTLGQLTESNTANDLTPGVTFSVLGVRPSPLILNNISAYQRCDTRRVAVAYALFGATANIALTFSSNGGASWDVVPLVNALSGDYGADIVPGAHTIEWQADQQLSANTYNNNFRVRLVATADGVVTNISEPFTVDLRSLQGGLTVAGKVLDANTRQSINGVSIGLAGQNTTTRADGSYLLTGVALNNGTTLIASKTAYASHQQTVLVPAEATRVTVPDICLQAITVGNINKPIVTKLEPRLKGIFLSGTSLENDLTASVNWNGLTPGSVRFYANESLVGTMNGSGPEYACTVDMGSSFFRPTYDIRGNMIKVQAVSGEGSASEFFILYLAIIPVPEALKYINPQGDGITAYRNGEVALDYDFPNPPIKANLQIPVIGKFGFEVAANGSFDYTITDGDWELALGVGAEGTQGKRGRRPSIPGLTRYPKMKLYIGNKEICGKVEAGARGTATLNRGITFDQVFGHGELEANLELGRLGVLDLLGPGLSKGASAIPGLGDLVKTISVIIYGVPRVEGDIVFALQPSFAIDSLEMTGKIALEASYEPNLGFAEMRLYVGGEPSVTFQVPGDLFKNVRFRAYAGAEFTAWILSFNPSEYVFLDVSYPDQHSDIRTLNVSESSGVLALPGVRINGVSPISREYRKHGVESFVAAERTEMRSLSANSSRMSSLDAFRLIGRSPVRGSVQRKATMTLNATGQPATKSLAVAEASDCVSQANVQIISNAFPYSQPALAGVSSNLLLLYVADNANSNALQFTDIRWSRFDGCNWSLPTSIVTDTRAEFNPHVAYDGNGDAVAVWERVADPNFTNVDLSAMAAQMEVVYAMWDHGTGQWTDPMALTTNSYLDHMPLLAGPLANGDLLVTWTKNEGNLLMGTGTVGAVVNDAVMWSRWNSSAKAWNEPAVLVSNLTYRLSQSLACSSNRGVYAWTADGDGILTNDADQNLFVCQLFGDSWSAPVQYPTNGFSNKNIHLAVSPNEDVYAIWQQGANLMMDVNFSGNRTVVRADSQTAGFADYAMTYGPAGNLVLLWQEMCEDGSDMHYSVYDPASVAWSKDARFFKDATLKRSFAPIWDDVGNLTVAYNTVEIFKTNKVVELEGGGSVTVSNVPQPGMVGIAIMKRALIADVAILPGDFTVQGANYLPGDAVTLSAMLRNVGDVAVSNAAVAFYDGDPGAGGTLITNLTWAGWLEGAATNASLSTLWVVPEPATNRRLYAVANAGHAIIEFMENNNTQVVSIGGADFSVTLISATSETNGALRVIVQVQNLGAPGTTNTILALRRQGQSGTPLGTVEVLALEPGRLAQVALDLPAGTQPEGKALYTLKVDDAMVVADVNTNNNTASFAVNLWIDSDGDGIPNWWMTNQFGHVTGLASDNSRAEDDADGDGMNTYAEWRAGTEPHDPDSFLVVQGFNYLGSNTLTGGFRLTWGSVSNKFYTIERTSDLVNGAGFVPIQQHILATPPVNTYLDTTVATKPGPFFYRIVVE